MICFSFCLWSTCKYETIMVCLVDKGTQPAVFISRVSFLEQMSWEHVASALFRYTIVLICYDLNAYRRVHCCDCCLCSLVVAGAHGEGDNWQHGLDLEVVYSAFL